MALGFDYGNKVCILMTKKRHISKTNVCVGGGWRRTFWCFNVVLFFYNWRVNSFVCFQLS